MLFFQLIFWGKERRPCPLMFLQVNYEVDVLDIMNKAHVLWCSSKLVMRLISSLLWISTMSFEVPHVLRKIEGFIIIWCYQTLCLMNLWYSAMFFPMFSCKLEDCVFEKNISGTLEPLTSPFLAPTSFWFEKSVVRSEAVPSPFFVVQNNTH